jgi:hypothetical protein
MAHSIELLLDPRTDTAIRAAWQALADAGLPSQVNVKSPTNRPHITLLAAERISPDVDDVLRQLSPRLPMDAVVGAPLVFGGHSLTLARLIVSSAQLLDFHEEVYRRTLPFVAGAPFGHCAPGHWTPHATVARRLSPEQIGAALTAARGLTTDLASRIVGLRRWDSDQRIDHILVG